MNNKKLLIIILVFLVGIIFLSCGVYACSYFDTNNANLKKVQPETVEELGLEYADDENYSDFKAEFEKMLLEKTGKKSEKTVFFVYGSIYNYKVDIYFKIKEEWYKTTKGAFSQWISPKFDKAVLEEMI